MLSGGDFLYGSSLEDGEIRGGEARLGNNQVVLCRSKRSQAPGSDSHASHETGLGGTSSAAGPLSYP